jgi:hypothetical protein
MEEDMEAGMETDTVNRHDLAIEPRHKNAPDMILEAELHLLRVMYADVCAERDGMRALNGEMSEALKKYELFDKFGVEITDGCVVHWTDGGDELTLEERIATRWDRVAVVKRGPKTTFTVIDSPRESIRNAVNMTFTLGAFIYENTAKYLTVVAGSETEYRDRFKNAGDCMAYVLVKSEGY